MFYHKDNINALIQIIFSHVKNSFSINGKRTIFSERWMVQLSTRLHSINIFYFSPSENI